MTLIVKKYGGTSLATPEHFKRVAETVAASIKLNERVVLVLSAMAGETNRLVSLAKEFGDFSNTSHCDLLLATGEQISIALMSLALLEKGIDSETFFAPNMGIFTDDAHGKARIERIETAPVLLAMDKSRVPIIAGFQGLTCSGVVTTLGRGGSDITAIAVAAALNADRCDIITDVEGVFTADPTKHKSAKIIKKISYEELLELADAGAKVVHGRAVEVAAKFKVPLNIRHYLSSDSGTDVLPEDQIIERPVVSAVTANVNEAKLSIRMVPDRIGVVGRIFEPISKANIDVDLIIQNVSKDGFSDLSFTIPKADLKRSLAVAELAAKGVGAGVVEADANIAKLSVVGVGMRSHPGVAHKIFDTLAGRGIAIQMIGTSEIKVSLVIEEKRAEEAVEALLAVFL